MDDLRTYEERTGTAPHKSLKGETQCPGCHQPAPAEWKEWGPGVLTLTFRCACGDHFDFTDDLEEEAA